MTMNPKIIYSDCIEYMKSMEPKSIDFILTDPPYGMIAPDWDQIIDFEQLWHEYNRIIKDQGTIALFASQPFTSKLILSNEHNFKYCWYWIKNQGTNFYHAKSMPIRKIEEICIFKNGRYFPQMSHNHKPTNSAIGSYPGKTYYGLNKRNYKGGVTTRYPTNILEFKCVDNYSRMHPTQKPVELFEYLIKTYTKENDIVLDNCSGSGTTGIACINTNRNYILIEKDETYYNLAKQRIENHKNNLNLNKQINFNI